MKWDYTRTRSFQMTERKFWINNGAWLGRDLETAVPGLAGGRA
jgi:hypothetical protein